MQPTGKLAITWSEVCELCTPEIRRQKRTGRELAHQAQQAGAICASCWRICKQCYSS